MILLCGIPSEAPLRLVIEAAEALGKPYVIFNQRESHHTEFCLDLRRGHLSGTLRTRETDWSLEKFSGVYVRTMDYRLLPENQSRIPILQDRQALEKSQLLHDSLYEWLEICDCRVMNRNSAMGSNMSKPYQARFIMQAGFHTPITLITNEPDDVRAFFLQHRQVIYKSISSIRSIVQKLDDVDLAELCKVRNLPTQFQAFVPGINIRVHVAGKRIFATEIRSDAIDYRYAEQEGFTVDMVPIELPECVSRACLCLSQRLNLPLCGIDLKRTPDDDFYCFEINPSPGYSYYQQHTGQPIAEAIVEYLSP